MTVLSEIMSPKSDLDDEVLIQKLFFTNNDKVKKNDELLEIETSKTAIVLESPVDGFIEYKFKEGQSIKVGEIIALIHDSVFESKIEMNESKNDSGSKVISAAADAFIQENDIDISNINKKFITLKDLLKEETIPIFDDNYADNKVQLSSLKTKSKPIEYSKKAEIKALSSVNTGGLISTISIYVNAVTIETEDGLFSNTNNSYLPIIIYETSKLLKKYPILNSYFDHDHILEYVDINIGLALHIDDGLKIYNIRNCNKLSLEKVKDQISEGVYQYLRKDLTLEDITGSTFTITDLSPYGVCHFVPLVNNMQSAILGISAVDKMLKRFTLTLSFDHRVTEGKIVSEFLSDLSKVIEKYEISKQEG
jgi:pyruvate/2-oxoglutarate dehydrogenase complex dihydrolipoamide acyltransferase (E2) component